MEIQITDVTASSVTNSRGTNTIAVSVHVGEHVGTFALPDGASTGSREVHVKEVSEALVIIAERIKPALLGYDVTNQAGIDALLHEIDGTEYFDSIGGNVALGVSVASCKAASHVQAIPTWKYIETLFGNKKQAAAPRLFVNLINGGKHAIHGSAVQEHQIIVDTDDVSMSYKTACAVQEKLEQILIEKYGAHVVTKGDEGGFVVPSQSVFEPFDYLMQAIDATESTVPVFVGADVAASSFYEGGKYTIEGKVQRADELRTFYKVLHAHVPQLRFVEDPFFESDFSAYHTYSEAHKEVLVIGDDLTTTNSVMLRKAIETEAIGGIIIKPNQIGTLTDTLRTMELAYANNIKCIVSHRSGETLDDFIADLAWGTGSYGLKAGAPHAIEREAKYQRLITISHTYNV